PGERHMVNGSLGAVVGSAVRKRPLRMNGADHDDRSAALLDHLPGGQLTAMENTPQGDVPNFLDVGRFEVDERLADIDCGIIDEDVEAAGFIENILEKTLQTRPVRDIRAEVPRRLPGLTNCR